MSLLFSVLYNIPKFYEHEVIQNITEVSIANSTPQNVTVSIFFVLGIMTEEKANVVAAIWGTALIQFLAGLATVAQDDLKKEMNSSYSSYRPGAIYPILQIVLMHNSLRSKEIN